MPEGSIAQVVTASKGPEGGKWVNNAGRAEEAGMCLRRGSGDMGSPWRTVGSDEEATGDRRRRQGSPTRPKGWKWMEREAMDEDEDEGEGAGMESLFDP